MNDVPMTVIADAIDYIVTHWQDQPDLAMLARRAGYDVTHFQKIFTDLVGISPKKLGQYLQARQARHFLLEGYKTLEAAYEAGLSGTGRLFDVMVTVDAATPLEVMQKGAGLTIHYGFHPTVLGDILVAQTARGLCWLGFVMDGDKEVSLARLRAYWPRATFICDGGVTQEAADRIMAMWRGKADRSGKMNLHLYGTNFQLQVWQALLKIPAGGAVSYKHVADYLGKPKASRAVGGAVGANPVSLLIPCHRVIQMSGIIDNYGWGTPRKRLLLALERGASESDLLDI